MRVPAAALHAAWNCPVCHVPHLAPPATCSSSHSCDTRQGEESLCRLAGTSYKRLLVMHDATGKGLPPADVAVFCDALQAAAKAAR